MKIAQILHAGSWGEVTPETINKGLGGRETAMIKLAESWANVGHEVTNFVNTEKGKRFPTVYDRQAGWKIDSYIGPPGYHEYLPIGMTKMMLSHLPWDAVITWEIPSVFADDDIRNNSRLKICEMQVAHLHKTEQEAANKYCDYVAALSPWHAEFLEHSDIKPKKGNIVFPNGVDLARYPLYAFNAKLEQWKGGPNPSFVYSSSPDRGLWHILKSWKSIREIFPEATLSVCYGFDKYIEQIKWAHVRQAEMCVEMAELITQPGVINRGKIGQDELAKLQLEATAWIYPLDALWPTETGCITAVENAAAGNPLIISDGDCLEAEFGEISMVSPLPFNQDHFIGCIEEALTDLKLYREMQIAGRLFAETRTWEDIGQKWLELFANDPS